jgi:hypothetical protein
MITAAEFPDGKAEPYVIELGSFTPLPRPANIICLHTGWNDF